MTPPRFDRGAPLAPQIAAEMTRLRAAGPGPAAAELIEVLLAGHARPHVCWSGEPGGPGGTVLYGEGLPFGPNCPMLMLCADRLEAALPGPEGSAP